MGWCGLTHMPFSDRACRIARILEHLADQGFTGGDAFSAIFLEGKPAVGQVERRAKAVRIATRHQSHPARPTERVRDIGR